MPFTKDDPNINREGRPKGSGGGLKDFDRKRFLEMSDEEKIEFLDKISPEIRYKMAEGNPHQDTNVDAKIQVSGVEINVRK